MTHTELRAMRKAMGLSQRELGILAGLKPTAAAGLVNRHEAGTVKPSGPTMRAYELILQLHNLKHPSKEK